MTIKTLQVFYILMSMMLGYVTSSYSEVDDGKLFDLAQHELKLYLESQPNASKWEITVSYDDKIVTTNWFRDHKGEVILKAEIRVHEGLIRVDVWHRGGYIFHTKGKTEWSRRVEWEIQRRIEVAESRIK
ncbi:MAG: hypothetical protein ABSA86_10800 [Oryzomonas sp.]|jgi:hypothetical protein